ncbi:ISL3 family transposase [Salisediminibacterium selenitireducens]|uniref:Transposase IS204/IS1001/IS1096/IS1165 family protein n=1 Tax=Bacillus selenitireducens (strain ATCC 700615 / DSM 15326 / MLS10) TaxID=439292 RepID=D6XZT7_BACIE|nr:ISL3 family transposase [Salisediminibacterium selenitireducens]ADI00439.1 transposase IS204/IS1001/IS1096/IS1165 family protein [[Bacillus] selenitireducens MLS10]
MHDHFIIEMLWIKDGNVKVWDVSYEDEQILRADLYTEKRKQKCPSCGNKTKRVHGYRNQMIQGPRLVQGKVTVSLRKRRYACGECGKTFYERLQMIERYQRALTSVQNEALMYAADSSFTTAARWAGISVTRLIRLFDRREMKTPTVLPRAIAIDEFKGDAGGERFQTIIVDVERKEIVDILPDRKVDTIKKYLRSCDTSGVEIVVMDLSKWFKKAVRDVLGDPLIIADRFHFMRQVYWALDEVRRDVQGELDKKSRIHMKRSKKLLWKSHYDLNEEQKLKVEKLLQIDPKLREAYELKNLMEQWFRESDHETASKQLDKCLEALRASNTEGFKRVRKTFMNWRQEILQAFMYPFNNGYIEGVNNTIKVMKRTSYGIKNFERMRNKILWNQEMKMAMGS